MSWLERLSRPTATTIVFHRHDSPDPIIHRLQGLWVNEALFGVLEALVQEYYDPFFDTTCEILYQKGAEQWGEEVELDLRVRGV